MGSGFALRLDLCRLPSQSDDGLAGWFRHSGI